MSNPVTVSSSPRFFDMSIVDTPYTMSTSSVIQQNAQEVPFPMFEIAANRTFNLSEIRQRRFNIIDSANIQARADIQAEEDRNILNAIEATGVCTNPYAEVALAKEKAKEKETLALEKAIQAIRSKIVNAIFKLEIEDAD